MKHGLYILTALLIASGCRHAKEPGAAAQGPQVPVRYFGWESDILQNRIREGMTIQEVKQATGFAWLNNQVYHTDTLTDDTCCTVTVSNGVIQKIQTGHNGVCLELDPELR